MTLVQFSSRRRPSLGLFCFACTANRVLIAVRGSRHFNADGSPLAVWSGAYKHVWSWVCVELKASVGGTPRSRSVSVPGIIVPQYAMRVLDS